VFLHLCSRDWHRDCEPATGTGREPGQQRLSLPLVVAGRMVDTILVLFREFMFLRWEIDVAV
jgi:hypothetical protein